MNFTAVLFAIAGLIVADFYAIESFLFFQANGFATPLVVKLLICGIGIYFFLRNVKRIKKPGSGSPPTTAA